MEYQSEEEKIYPLHYENCFKSVKRVRDLTEFEKNYLKTLEPFICISGTLTLFSINTRWYSGKGENEKRVYRLDPFSNIGQNTLVTDSFWEVLKFGAKLLQEKFPELFEEWWNSEEEDREEEILFKFKQGVSFYNFLENKGEDPDLVLVGIFVPLSDCLKQNIPEIITYIDLQELKEK
ncbi:MAG: hypothetical protein AUJ85_07120 [Elusimicrobia bacterium CG1_02_37_114]|nr:MAG: hypothetical protein AUJ85_07120 [Elusimicrobia bacterium CG1_02_37_114]PIZ13644.1 MAG: hypothetical protein COY53_03770 [Elusimicrobia bacterium CG_4_10_14_0_8_um_filter_37_32]